MGERQRTENPERRKLAVRAFSEGHRLGNHSYSHTVPFGLLEKPAEAVNEILYTDALLGELRGSERLYRPYGRGSVGKHLLNPAAWEVLIANEFTCVLWNCIPPEQKRPDSWMEPAISQTIRLPDQRGQRQLAVCLRGASSLARCDSVVSF